MRKAPITLTLMSSAALALTACSGHSAQVALAAAQQAATAPASLPDMLDNADGLQTVAEALKVTGVATAFKGRASYTLLAPEDGAFAAAGDPDNKLMAPGDHTALAALIKDHILPGRVTPRDINAAIDASPDGQVTMSSLGGEELTFTRSGKTITVTAPDGSGAQFDGEPVIGGSSIAIPITSVLNQA